MFYWSNLIFFLTYQLGVTFFVLSVTCHYVCMEFWVSFFFFNVWSSLGYFRTLVALLLRLCRNHELNLKIWIWIWNVHRLFMPTLWWEFYFNNGWNQYIICIVEFCTMCFLWPSLLGYICPLNSTNVSWMQLMNLHKSQKR